MNITFNCSGHTSCYYDTLKSICGITHNKSMIDLGSGNAPSTRRLGFTDKLYIDIVNRDIGEENKYFVKQDILDFIKKESNKKYDVSISSDNIEHFWVEQGIELIKWMEINSSKQVIFTPIGEYITIFDKTNTDPDTHKSGWIPDDFNKLGWATIAFPKFHPTLGENGLGAFFAFNCENLEQEFSRVKNELNNKSWAK